MKTDVPQLEPPPTRLRCLTVFQPWAWLLVNGWKDRENRPRLCRLRGPLLIHAAARRSDRLEYLEAQAARRIIDELPEAQRLALLAAMPGFNLLPRGGITGIIDITSDTRADEALRSGPWYCGPEAYATARAAPLEFEPCRGAQGVWFYKGTLHTTAAEKLAGPTLAPTPCETCQAAEQRDGFLPLRHFLLACTCHHSQAHRPA